MTVAYWNNEKFNLNELRIPMTDRSFFFGDGVYEVIRIYGGKFFLLDEHLKRLSQSCRAVEIDCKLDQIREVILRNARENQVHNGTTYIQISRGTQARNHSFAKKVEANTLVYSQEFDEEPYKKYISTGISVTLERDTRWLRRDIKSVNLLANCIAKTAAERSGAQEAILVEDDGTVTEGSTSNVFIVTKGVLVTHPSNEKILGGITRIFALECAQNLGLTIHERPIQKDELLAAEEIFITSTTAEVMPVAQIVGTSICRRTWPMVEMIRKEFEQRRSQRLNQTH